MLHLYKSKRLLNSLTDILINYIIFSNLNSKKLENTESRSILTKIEMDLKICFLSIFFFIRYLYRSNFLIRSQCLYNTTIILSLKKITIYRNRGLYDL